MVQFKGLTVERKLPAPNVLREIQKRIEKGENLWRIIDQYDLTTDEKIEILRLFDDQKWDQVCHCEESRLFLLK